MTRATTSTLRPDPLELDDEAFDRYLPEELRSISGQYWTSLAVAARVADWLAELEVRTVVDIGSGVGKFCVAAARRCTCHFTGIEQRERFVTAARALARSFEVDDRVSFLAGTLDDVEVPVADVYYLYNPFGENLFRPQAHLAPDVELSEQRFDRDVATVERLLENAPAGTYVLTYNGFGGNMPRPYGEVRVDLELPNVLRLWRKQPGSERAAIRPSLPGRS